MRILIAALMLYPAVAFGQGWPDLAKPPTASGGGEKDAALLVGVEQYLDVPAVAGATANVEDFYAFLTRTLHVPPASVTLLRNREATVEKMRKFAGEAAARVKPGGTLWFVFVGHGAPAQDGRDGVLVGYDAQQDADSLYARSLPRRDLVDVLAKGKQGRTMVVIDACFSGRTSNGTALVKGLQPLIAVSARPAAQSSVVMMTAGRADQFAGPLPGVARPAFSYLVLGALRGWGDSNGDGAVSPQEAMSYSRDALATLVKDRSQTPELDGSGADPLVHGAREKGPDLAGMALGTGATPRTFKTTLSPQTNEDCVDDVSCAKLEACLGGDLKACMTTAQLVGAEDLGSAKGESRRMRLYQRACDGGSADGCTALGQILVYGTFNKNPPRAIPMLEKACEAKNAGACSQLGAIFSVGAEGVPKAPDRTLALFARACDLADASNAHSCMSLAPWYEFGLAGAKKDPARATALYKRACELAKLEMACKKVFELENPEAAKTNQFNDVSKKCNGGDMDLCMQLAQLYDAGTGTAKSEAKGLETYEKLCWAGRALGCYIAGTRWMAGTQGAAKNMPRAVQIFEKGCNMRDDQQASSSCLMAAVQYRFGTGLPKDVARARDLYKKACDLGVKLGCDEYAQSRDWK